MNVVGARISEWRKEREWSQAELAKRAGASQATISRIEGSGEETADLPLLAKIALAFDRSLRDLVEGSDAERLLESFMPESFCAFCPNPLCPLNEHGMHDDGKAFVRWKSFARHPAPDFSEINFCPRCRSKLIKECDGCGRLIETAYAEYCVRCGKQISTRPTAEEWKKIYEKAKRPTSENSSPKVPPVKSAADEWGTPPMGEEDIPF